MLQFIINPNSAGHFVATVIKTAISVHLPVPHASRKSFPVGEINSAESLPLAFAKLSFVLYPIFEAIIKIKHVHLIVAYLRVEQSAKALIQIVSP